MISAIRRDLASIIARLHRVDFSDKAAFDPMSQAGGPSGYMKDLVDKLEFVRTQILARYSVGALNTEWCVSPAHGFTTCMLFGFCLFLT